MEPACVYDISASYAHNIQQGPQWSGPVPDRCLPPQEQWVDFLGHKVASRLGVPAGPLLDSRWTAFAGRMGFDILTYKTIRAQPSTGHPPPNILYLQVDKQLTAADAATPLISAGQHLPHNNCLSSSSSSSNQGAAQAEAAAAADGAASTAAAAAAPVTDDSRAGVSCLQQPSVAITNSFGMPSMDREYLMRDIPAGTAALGPGQVLVVSVTGTPNRPDGVTFTDDFVQAALLAQQAGASIIEANLSCPNVGKGQGALYTDPEQVSALSSALVSALGPHIPLIIKVGAFDDAATLEAVLTAAAAAGVRGVAGINGLSRTVLNPDGSPALGPDRPTSGVCGAPIYTAALEFVRTAREVINCRRLGLTLIGVGGVSSAQQVLDMLAAGADFVQAATGFMWNPLLAQQYHSLVATQQQVVQGEKQQQRQEKGQKKQVEVAGVSLQGAAAAVAAAGAVEVH